MKNYYKNTYECMDEYNQILNKICTSTEETTDGEDERLQNHPLYLAHALVKDIVNVDDLKSVANIILAIVK